MSLKNTKTKLILLGQFGEEKVSQLPAKSKDLTGFLLKHYEFKVSIPLARTIQERIQ
jgi:hypothetical protein